MNSLFKRLAVLAVCISTAVFAVACSDNKEQENTQKDKQQNQSQTQEKQEGQEEQEENDVPKAGIPTHLVFGEGKDNIEISGKAYEAPSEQDVIDAYKKASEAILWFNGYAVPALDKNSMYSEDGVQYAKVKSQTVTDFKSLREYLEGVFDFDMADLLMEDNGDTKRFTERQDGLYCVAYNRYRGVADEVYSVSKESEDEYVITVDYKQVDAKGTVIQTRTAKYSFVNVDGKWAFDINFTLHCI